jgi:Protein of unknown function (DUF1579)
LTPPTIITAFEGTWQGIYNLWLSPENPARKPESHAEVSTIAQGQFVQLRYTWADNGTPQEGRLIISRKNKDGIMKAVWLDSWHMKNSFMICEGSIMTNGIARVTGSYAAPSGPDWGWQIDIEPQERDTFQLVMYNISPEGDKMLAVEVRYTRVN